MGRSSVGTSSPIARFATVVAALRTCEKSSRFSTGAICLLRGSQAHGFASRCAAPRQLKVDRVIFSLFLTAGFAGCGDRIVFVPDDVAAVAETAPFKTAVDVTATDTPDIAAAEAAPADLGPPDSGPPDFGAPDGAPPDLGLPDVGPSDAEPPDVEPPDIGPPPADVPAQPCTNDDQCPPTATPCVEARCLLPEPGDPAPAHCGYAIAQDSSPCDDGDPCTAEEKCVQGKCKNGSAACGCAGDADCTDDGNLCNGVLYCDKSAGNGVCQPNPKTIVVCPQAGPCATASCEPATAKCTSKPHDGPCDDGNPCTANDSCNLGSCASGPSICTCLGDKDCPDDGNLCNGKPVCDTAAFPFVCKAGVPLPPCATPTGAPCLLAVCAPTTGGCALQASATGTACDDSDPCTSADSCSNGTCGGVAANCDDSNPCSTDSCDSKTGKCSNLANTLPCNDQQLCTAADTCTALVCKGKPLVCDDGNLCTDDACQPAKGCVATNNSAPCTDNNLCTQNDGCVSGLCAGTAKNCDDKNACTSEICTPSSGQCAYTLLTAPCSDGNACTLSDACKAGACVGAPAACDDKNPCTQDGCDAAKGCVNAALADNSGCDDGNPCTSGDFCLSGACKAKVLICEDGNSCTTDSCVVGKGCQFVAANGIACDDGTSCTQNDTCKLDKCSGTFNCDDKNICTADSCAGAACANTATGGNLCDDGNACTSKDNCTNGKCVGVPVTCTGSCAGVTACDPATGCKTSAQICDDGNPCTNDTCLSNIGCANFAATDGIACTQNGAPSTCKMGVCGACNSLQLLFSEPGFDVNLRGIGKDGGGNLYVAGSTAKLTPQLPEDGYFAVVSSAGQLIKKQILGDAGSDVLTAAAAANGLPNAAQFVAGYFTDTKLGKGLEGWLLALKPDGGVVYDKKHGAFGDDQYWAAALRGTTLLAVGNLSDKAWVNEIDPATGDPLPSGKTFGLAAGKNMFKAIAVIPGSPATAYVAGSAVETLGNTRALVAALSATNDLAWSKVIGTGSPLQALEALATVQTSSGTRLVAAGWQSDGVNHNPWLLIINPATGAIDSERTEIGLLPRAYAAVATSDAGIVATVGGQALATGKVLSPQFGWFANWPPSGQPTTAHVVAVGSTAQALRGLLGVGNLFAAVGQARYPSTNEYSGWLVQLGTAGKPACLPQ